MLAWPNLVEGLRVVLLADNELVEKTRIRDEGLSQGEQSKLFRATQKIPTVATNAFEPASNVITAAGLTSATSIW